MTSKFKQLGLSFNPVGINDKHTLLIYIMYYVSLIQNLYNFKPNGNKFWNTRLNDIKFKSQFIIFYPLSFNYKSRPFKPQCFKFKPLSFKFKPLALKFKPQALNGLNYEPLNLNGIKI